MMGIYLFDQTIAHKMFSCTEMLLFYFNYSSTRLDIYVLFLLTLKYFLTNNTTNTIKATPTTATPITNK